MQIKYFLSITILIVATIACATLQPQKNYSSVEQIFLPTERNYHEISLIENKIIVFDRDKGSLYYALENTTEFVQIPDKRKDFCPEDNFYKILSYSGFVSVLPDQRIGLIGDCMFNEDYMFAYDIKTGKMEKIVENKLPVPANNFSWNPTMTKGIQDSYTFLDGTIFWLDFRKASAINITLSDGKKSWSLATDFPDIVGDGKQGIAAHPVWSPNGKQIAFFATFDPIGKSGFSILDSEYSIYIMDYETLVPVSILEGVYRDFDITLDWSPNEKYLSFTGKYGFPKQYGLWILNLESKNVYFIDKNVTNSVWRNDSKSIVGIKCNDGLCEKQKTWEYWLNDLK